MKAKNAFAGWLYQSQALGLLKDTSQHLATISRQFMNELSRLCGTAVAMRELRISYRRLIGEKRYYIELRFRSAVTYMLFYPLGPSLYIGYDTYCRAGCLHPLRWLRIRFLGPNEFETDDLSMLGAACQQVMDEVLRGSENIIDPNVIANVRGKWTLTRSGSGRGFRRA
jgi:hypothetical protein